MTSILQSVKLQHHKGKGAWHIEKVQVIHFGLGTWVRKRLITE